MKSKNYDDFLKQEITDASLAAEYLFSAIQDGSIDEFLIALRNVAEAHGGIGNLSEITNLNRQSMYKMLSEDGNPTLSSLITVLKAMGINLNFSADGEKEAA